RQVQWMRREAEGRGAVKDNLREGIDNHILRYYTTVCTVQNSTRSAALQQNGEHQDEELAQKGIEPASGSSDGACYARWLQPGQYRRTFRHRRAIRHRCALWYR